MTNSQQSATNGYTHMANGAKLKPTPAEREVMEAQALSEKATSMVEAPDRDWIKSLAALNIDFKAIPSGLDYVGMRRWLKDSYEKVDRKFNHHSWRTPTRVSKSEVMLENGDDEGSFRCVIWEPEEVATDETSRPVILMYHGGGFIHGFPELDEDLAVVLASDLRAVVVGVDYRLAPEHKFSTILNDCRSAVEWIIEHADRYNVDAKRIGLWGASAGAHLAANVAMLEALAHEPSRICQASLVVPLLCHVDECPNPLSDVQAEARQRMDDGPKQALDMAMIGARELFNFMRPDGVRDDDPEISPLRRPGPWPSHHAAVHVTVGGCDLLRDQGIAYYMALQDNGIEAELQLIPGVPHGFTWASRSRAVSQWLDGQIKVFELAFRGSRS
ncbi:Alpha/Beta hydrolase protein [Kockovaella imperatae]|uniref:Alpha/Beta hydrolase protein n=1 Tax=Kockovaella imperatae TaxID=4999 RepID=A0A1Y1UHF9_9TREE|nr:Alpha/Beta hydrolase protein [Kockovaella imperatae]ORX36967.1 Alpha/Beta hydrolase protein [Kockovaella imperatae]